MVWNSINTKDFQSVNFFLLFYIYNSPSSLMWRGNRHLGVQFWLTHSPLSQPETCYNLDWESSAGWLFHFRRRAGGWSRRLPQHWIFWQSCVFRITKNTLKISLQKFYRLKSSLNRPSQNFLKSLKQPVIKLNMKKV